MERGRPQLSHEVLWQGVCGEAACTILAGSEHLSLLSCQCGLGLAYHPEANPGDGEEAPSAHAQLYSVRP